MAGDRRQSDTRRAADRRANDRRTDSDRRTAAGRRMVDESTAAPPGAAADNDDEDEEEETLLEMVGRYARMAVMVGVILLAVCAAGAMYVFGNFGYFVGRASQQITVEMTRASLDPDSLTDKAAKAQLAFNVKNPLPVQVVLQSVTMDLKLGSYDIAKETRFNLRQIISPFSASTVATQMQVDSIMARRGLQKVVGSRKKPLLARAPQTGDPVYPLSGV